ncbi:MAG: Fe-S cluster assembly protein SufD [Gammaproteobacteria bacterium]|nr:Fe-S cluster assembly protein SufD [Gammaproteobacteria bacterium]
MKTETWKYTNIKKWLERDYQTIDSYAPIIDYNELPEGVIICPLADASKQADIPSPYPLPQALEGKLKEQGFFIYIPKNVVLKNPIYITDIAAQLDDPTVLPARFQILLEENSVATIVHKFEANDANHYWRRQVTEINLAPNAQLNYYQDQNEAPTSLHTHYIAVQQGRDSQFNSFTLDNGGGIVRTDLHTKLHDVNATCHLNGLYLVKNKQHVDNHTIIEHLAPHTQSSEHYKGIVADQARAVFNGRIYVAPHAQKVVSEQHNENLLLSKQAEIDTKPELEIYADDVQCAHGATVGQLDRDAIFYMTTRGIDEELAKQLLTYGFAHEMLNSISHDEIRALFNTQLLTWFSNNQELEDLLP